MRNGTKMVRPWGKKRGDRRTGSHLLGSLGEASFFAILFLLGGVSLTALITAQVLNPTPEIYQLGFGFWLVIMVLSSFILIGGYGMISSVLQFSASAERRSAMARKATQLELIRDIANRQDFPNVPRDPTLNDSPGVALAYRLPIETDAGWRLIAAALTCFLLSAFAAVLVEISIQPQPDGQFDWVTGAFTGLSLAAATWSVYYFLHQVLSISRVGPTCVEISDHPLRPGGEYAIFLSQLGRVHIRELNLALVCEEEATYQQGTDIRKETRQTYTQEILHEASVSVNPGSPFELQNQFVLPEDVMHSFQSNHNAVRWKLVVTGEPEASPQFCRTFPVIVYPTHSGKNGIATA